MPDITIHVSDEQYEWAKQIALFHVADRNRGAVLPHCAIALAIVTAYPKPRRRVAYEDIDRTIIGKTVVWMTDSRLPASFVCQGLKMTCSPHIVKLYGLGRGYSVFPGEFVEVED